MIFYFISLEDLIGTHENYKNLDYYIIFKSYLS